MILILGPGIADDADRYSGIQRFGSNDVMLSIFSPAATSIHRLVLADARINSHSIMRDVIYLLRKDSILYFK